MIEHVVNAAAKAAHEAWMAAQQAEGTESRVAAWGEEFMVEFDQLSPRGQEFDRIIVRAILEALDGLGFDVRERPARDPKVKLIDVKEFMDEGFLQEVNRQWLHPMGLALEVTQQHDGSWYISGVWDAREDPEGMLFEEHTLSEEKFRKAWWSTIAMSIRADASSVPASSH